MRRLFKNAILIDGTGAPGHPGALAIENEIIIDLGEISEEGFDDVVDVGGKVICPGFIDTHSHSDLQAFKTPHLAPKIMQGITTEFLGQDGISLAPLPVEYVSPWRKNLAGLDGDLDELDWTFRTTANYLSMLESNGSGTNLCYLVPHGNVRMVGRGLGGGIASTTELDAMKTCLDSELAAGCYGFSTGLIYMPCAYADTDEMVALCAVAAKRGVPLVIHQRSEADTILESMDEVLDIGRRSGVAIHFSHFKLCGKNNAHLFDCVIEKLDAAAKNGVSVSFDQYPYIAGSTMLGVILPPWAHDGGTDMLMERLARPEDRKRMTRDIAKGIPGWDNFVAFAGLDGIFITDVKTAANQNAIGKSLVELGEMRGKDPLEATYDLLLQEDNAVGMVDFYGLEEHVRAFIARPEMNVCTDGLMGGKPHPRAYGAFPRVLGKYVREEKIVPLHEAVRKMTGRPAEVFALRNRGLLKKGFAADVVVFDPDTIADKGTFTDPCQHPVGIRHVLVNGEMAVRDGVLDESILAGKVLRRRW